MNGVEVKMKNNLAAGQINEDSISSANVPKDDLFLNVFMVFLTILIIVVSIIIVVNPFESKEKKHDEWPEKVEENKPNEQQPTARIELNIAASTRVQSLVDAYANNFNNFKIKTDYSDINSMYTKLLNKQVDLIIATAPNKTELALAQKAGLDFELIPFVNEGFVFYTNVSNPVVNLNLSDISKIYSGEITNWKILKGNDAEIIAYQRPTDSMAQTALSSLVMNNLKLKVPTKEECISNVSENINVITNNSNGQDAIGYSYYYDVIKYGNDQLKLFSINGIEPNYDTIKTGKYPLLTTYYIVTLKNNGSESLNKFQEAILTEEGQMLAQDAGYVTLINN